MGIEYRNKKFLSNDSCINCMANIKYLENNGIERILYRQGHTDCQDRFLSVLKKQFPNKFNKVADYFDKNAIINMPCCSCLRNTIEFIDILNSSINNKLDIE